jgi:hypothetical protein
VGEENCCDREVLGMSDRSDPKIFLLSIHLGGTKSATDNATDYELSQAAFMRNRKTR